MIFRFRTFLSLSFLFRFCTIRGRVETQPLTVNRWDDRHVKCCAVQTCAHYVIWISIWDPESRWAEHNLSRSGRNPQRERRLGVKVGRCAVANVTPSYPPNPHPPPPRCRRFFLPAQLSGRSSRWGWHPNPPLHPSAPIPIRFGWWDGRRGEGGVCVSSESPDRDGIRLPTEGFGAWRRRHSEVCEGTDAHYRWALVFYLFFNFLMSGRMKEPLSVSGGLLWRALRSLMAPFRLASRAFRRFLPTPVAKRVTFNVAHNETVTEHSSTRVFARVCSWRYGPNLPVPLIGKRRSGWSWWDCLTS